MKVNYPLLFEISYSGTVPAVEESCENFNVSCKRLQVFLYNLSNWLEANEVPALLWSCVQVCDLDELEVIINNIHHALFLSRLL